MKIKCNFCNAIIDERLKNCPQCGAPLSGANRASSEQPKTIEELQAWYVAHHLPPENVTRFFIGKNIKEPKAFGIYKNEVGDCVVYKNKSTGERAIRYQGSDEAYAVNELYQRLKAEIVDQKGRNAARNRPVSNARQQTPPKKTKGGKGCLIAVIIGIVIMVLFAIFDKTPQDGYYDYHGTRYYHQGSSWYYYNSTTDDWYKAKTDPDINSDNDDDYRIYSPPEGKRFESTSWYDDGSTSDDKDWDDDNDWGDYDDDDWDNGSTDWDSDW